METDWRHGETRQNTVGNDDRSATATRVPALTVLAHPDPRRVGERHDLKVLALGHSIRLSRLEPVFRQPERQAEEDLLPLAERTISRQPIRLLGDARTGEVVVDVLDTRTAVVVDGRAVEERRTLTSEEVERGVVLLLGRKVALLLHLMVVPPLERAPHCGLVGESDAILSLRQEVARLAPLNVPVLLRGESGTGKELVARGLHEEGSRSNRPFVAVNMATLSPSLAAAELFGAARGAFTGADRKKIGLFQSAQGGTLFLDEIGETPVEVQAMLLRALESQTILPVGSVEPQSIDVRVIAATDARLEEAMAAGRFRVPLYHRLAGYALQLPPLRQRRDDIGRLLRFFLDQELQSLGVEAPDSGAPPMPSAEVVARLVRHDWPGNVRELRNVARRLAISGHAPAPQVLAQIEDLLTTPTDRPIPAEPPSVAKESVVKKTPTPRRRRRNPEDVTEEELLAALEANEYRMRDTAEALDLSRIGLYRRLEASPNVRKAADLGREEIDAALEAASADVESAAQALRVSVQGLKRRITALGQSRP